MLTVQAWQTADAVMQRSQHAPALVVPGCAASGSWSNVTKPSSARHWTCGAREDTGAADVTSCNDALAKTAILQ